MRQILKVQALKKYFHKKKQTTAAVDDVSFTIGKGECLGLVGESGCGKSTTARLLTRLIKPDQGTVQMNGRIQMIFQNPQSSFDPRQTLGDGIMEGMRNQGMSRKEARTRMLELLAQVELSPDYADRLPHEVSGGQCQRAAIARALAMEPELIVCDEATSALDVTVQGQIIRLIKKLQKEKGMSYLFICHDLALVQHVCDRVLVMQNGKIVEEGTPDQVIHHPKNAYTKMLVGSVLWESCEPTEYQQAVCG